MQTVSTTKRNRVNSWAGGRSGKLFSCFHCQSKHIVYLHHQHGSQALKKERKKRNKENSHDTEDVSCTLQHGVKDNYPQSGPVVRFLHGEPLAWASVSEECCTTVHPVIWCEIKKSSLCCAAPYNNCSLRVQALNSQTWKEAEGKISHFWWMAWYPISCPKNSF